MDAEMETVEGEFERGGARLYWRGCRPNGKPCGSVVLLHGWGEHVDRYGALIEHLVSRDYAVWSLDLRGHGRSTGPRGHLASWREFREDVHRFLDIVLAQQPDAPLFLYGHSMGGLIALEYVAREPRDIAGAILSAPALGWTLPPIVLRFAALMARIYPSLSRGPGAYADDPLRHGRSSVRLLTEEHTAMRWTNEAASLIRLPLLMLHGTEDRVVPIEACRAFLRRVGSGDASLLEYEGMGHFPHREKGADKFMRDITVWLDCHVSPKTLDA
jgi:alpha-beta hydrolase superfamily lysophospholipase